MLVVESGNGANNDLLSHFGLMNVLTIQLSYVSETSPPIRFQGKFIVRGGGGGGGVPPHREVF